MGNRDHHYNVPMSRLISARRFDAGYFRPEFIALDDMLAKLPGVKSLGELAEIEYGFMPTEDYATEDNGVPLIRVTNVLADGSIDMSDIKYIRKDSDRLQEKLVRVKDVLMVQCGNTTGKVAIVPAELEGHAYASFCFRIRPTTDEVTPEYLLAVLYSDIGYRQVWRSITYATVRPNTTKPYTKAIKIPLPPRDVQDRIAGAMQAAYAARRHKLAEAGALHGDIDGIVLRELGISIGYLKDEKHFLVNVSRLTGGRFDPDLHNTKYTGLISQLQERFRSKLTTLKSLCLPITSGATPLGSKYVDVGVPFLRVQNIEDDGSVNLGQLLHVTNDFAKTIERASVQDGDLLLVIVGATIGKSAVVSGITSFTVPNQAIARIRLREGAGLSTHFLQAFLHSPVGQIQISALKRPVAQGNLNLTETGQILVPIAEIETQDRVVTEITRRRAEAKRLRAEAEQAVAEAKARVERMLLGEEGA
jgi:restriction endonuclease S subunit